MKAFRGRRIQEGSFHVYFRGNHQNNVFYTNLDKIMFLKLCNTFAKRYQTVIQEFVLMDNHVHLHLSTNCLSEFMRRFLQVYSRWYNTEHKTEGHLFVSPFNSSAKFGEENQVDSMLYILQNPLNAKICTEPGMYEWSSYRFHFGMKSRLSEYISVDTSLIDNYFRTKRDLDNAIFDKQISIAEIKENQTPKRSENYFFQKHATYAEVLSFLRHYLSNPISLEILGRDLSGSFGKNGLNISLFTLNKQQKGKLAYILHRETNASYMLISRTLQLDYNYVKHMCKSGGEE